MYLRREDLSLLSRMPAEALVDPRDDNRVYQQRAEQVARAAFMTPQRRFRY